MFHLRDFIEFLPLYGGDCHVGGCDGLLVVDGRVLSSCSLRTGLILSAASGWDPLKRWQIFAEGDVVRPVCSLALRAAVHSLADGAPSGPCLAAAVNTALTHQSHLSRYSGDLKQFQSKLQLQVFFTWLNRTLLVCGWCMVVNYHPIFKRILSL